MIRPASWSARIFWKVIFRLENFLWSTFSCFTLDIQGHLLRFGTWTPQTTPKENAWGLGFQTHTEPHVRYDWMILGCLGFLKFMIKLDHFTVTLFCEGSRWYYPHQRNQPKKNKPTKTFQNDPNFFQKKQLYQHMSLYRPPNQLPIKTNQNKPSNQNNPALGAPKSPTRPSKRRPCRSSQAGELWSPIVPVKPRTVGRGVGSVFCYAVFEAKVFFWGVLFLG